MPYEPKRPALDPCPVEEFISMVSGKWKARILLLISFGYATFSEIHRHLPNVADHVLSTQLKALVEDGLIAKTAATARNGTGATYELTDEGRQIQPILEAMCSWGLGRLAARGNIWKAPAPKARAVELKRGHG